MRIPDLQRNLRKYGIDLALFCGGEDVRESSIAYFTGQPVDFGCLAVPSKGKPKLFVNGFEHERIRRMCKGMQVLKAAKNLFQDVHGMFPQTRVIGLTMTRFTLQGFHHLQSAFSTARIMDIAPLTATLRLQKTPEEIARIKKAISITEDILKEFYAAFSSFTSEMAAAHWLHKATIDAGCTLAFDPIIAAGRNSAVPHHVPGSKMQNGFVVVDFGIRRKGYCSDITRTLYKGKPGAAELRAYDKLKRVQAKAVKAVRAGRRMEEVEASARRWLGTDATLFIHRIGHALGVDVHDMVPDPERKNALPLLENSVVTIEPGLYKKGMWGMRIEDDVQATKRGQKVLTSLSRNLVITK